MTPAGDVTPRAATAADPGGSATGEGRAVLVTGGSGALGRLVVATLVAHDGVDRVVAVDRRPPDPAHDPAVVAVRAVAGALDLAGLCRDHGVDTIVHLALPGGDRAAGNGDAWSLVGGPAATPALLDPAGAAGVAHLVLVGSAAAYGYHPTNRGRRLDEDEPLRAHDRIDHARQAVEVERLLARARRARPGIAHLVLRLAPVLGPGTDDPFAHLLAAPVLPVLRDTPLSLVLAWDADVAAIVLEGVVQRRVGTYNIAGDGVITMREAATRLGRRVVPLPARVLGWGLALPGLARIAPVVPEHVDVLRYRPVLATERVQRDFPGLLTHTSVEALDHWATGTPP